ncbi:MAG: RelA/SpoT family protein [Candidatus Oleimicrobiaceae bacterium]
MEEKYRKACDALVRRVRRYNPKADIHLLERASQFSYQAHKDQLRKSGRPYFEHALAVAEILADLKLDPESIAAGFLHDIAEDTGTSLQEVEQEFGPTIAGLVDGVTKIGDLEFDSLEERQAEDFRKMIFSIIKDVRVILIKFADRLHNMRTLQYLPEKTRERVARETRDIYAPLAHRLGLARIRWELEDLAFKYLEPEVYEELSRLVREGRAERERYIQRVVRPIRHALKGAGIRATITGRPKHFYSIYNKIHRRGVPFEQIYDLFAIRIIVERVEECYGALGIVHALFTPVHERFKDYIATPKTNRYQSLHTTVVGPDGRMVEIQIRTREMHRIAEEGIAAHWKYKEGKVKEDELDKYLTFLRQFLDWEADTHEPREFLENLKIDLYRDEVFVFTPKGDLHKLPAGSTPVDFAFDVHTDIGLHCIAAKVNGKIVPLDYQLRSGDTVEIITSQNQRPNPDWIKFVRTTKARDRIKRWVRESLFESSVRIGEELLRDAFSKHRIEREHVDLLGLAQSFGFSNEQKLYAAIGRGDMQLDRIIRRLVPAEPKPVKEEDSSLLQRFLQRARGSAKGVRVQGEDNVLIEFAKCCQPVPGDHIWGFVTRGRGVVIHRTDCNNVVKLMEEPERHVQVEWDVDRDKMFLVSLYVLSEDRKGLLADISKAITDSDTEIVSVNMRKEDALAKGFIIVQVRNLHHLNRIIKRISKVLGVLNVSRMEPSSQQKVDVGS